MRNINSVISKRFPNSGLSILMHGVISLPDATSYDNLQCGPYGYFLHLAHRCSNSTLNMLICKKVTICFEGRRLYHKLYSLIS